MNKGMTAAGLGGILISSVALAALVLVAPSQAEAACASYDSSSDTINVTCDTTLPSVRSTINDSNQLKYLGSGQYLLRANIRVTDGDTLTVSNADGVSWLKIAGDRGIRVDGGADFIGVKVTSWSTSSNAVVNNGGDGPRAWIRYYDSERAVISDSEFGYLGFTGSSPWKRGLSFEASSNYVRIDDSEFHHFYYAFYSNKLSNAIISDSEYRNNHKYAIDPHTGTHNMDIVRNYVHDNYGPGIVCSYLCYDILIEDNYVHGNEGAGIFFTRATHDSTIRYNTIEDQSGPDSAISIQISESQNNQIYGNKINDADYGISLISSSPPDEDGISSGNRIYDNSITNTDYAMRSKAAGPNTFSSNEFGTMRDGHWIMSASSKIVIENQHFDNYIIRGDSGNNIVTIQDSGRIKIGSTTYDTDAAPYKKTLNGQTITVDSV
jgi:hypothetical protein